MSSMIKQIAILGSGMPLTMATAILATSLKPFNIKVLALEISSQNNPPVAEVCGPEFTALCQILGLNEQQVISQCEGTFRLGSRYQDNQQSWFVPYAHLGLSAEQDDFEQGLFRSFDGQAGASLNAFSAASAAALAGKFAIAGSNRPDLRQALDYGVSLNRDKYRACVQMACKQPNVTWVRLPETAIEVLRDSNKQTSAIRSDKEEYVADFWFDLSDDACLTLEQTPQSTGINLSQHCHWTTDTVILQQPYTQLQRLNGGWLKITRLRTCTEYQAYVSAGVELAEFEQQLAQCDLGYDHAVDWHSLDCSVLAEPWQGNCLTLGPTAMELSDLLYTPLQCLQQALVLFVDLFPDLPISEHHRQHYHRQWHRYVTDARDFTLAHFLPADKALHSLADTLITRIQVFQRLGRIEPMKSDAVTESQWYHLLFGLGFRPELPSVVLSKINGQELNEKVEKVRHAIASLVKGMPSQEQYLARFYPLTSI